MNKENQKFYNMEYEIKDKAFEYKTIFFRILKLCVQRIEFHSDISSVFDTLLH